ncbi:hypothetical protein ACFOLD_13630 [Kocuria carniphila]|uniref:hypothetical protein n=1 Tax=Kocuria carniphila TaxID=262208 RepID=UPI00360631DF
MATTMDRLRLMGSARYTPPPEDPDKRRITAPREIRTNITGDCDESRGSSSTVSQAPFIFDALSFGGTGKAKRRDGLGH